MVCITNILLENIPEGDETISEANTDLYADKYVEVIKNIKNIQNFLKGKELYQLQYAIS